jgi:hypothetical protein
MKNGIHPNVPRHEYDLLLDRVNYSTLKLMKRSALHYQHAIKTRPQTLEQLDARVDAKQRDVLLGGEATHVAALEPDLYGGEEAQAGLDPRSAPPRGRFLVYRGIRNANFGDYKPVLARAALNKQKIITGEMHETALAIAKAVRSNLDVAPYIAGGHRELTVCWDYEEPQVAMLDGWTIAMRCRIDYLTDAAIIDLKSTYDASPEEFSKQMWNQGCFVQAAMQQDGVAAVTRRIRPYFWLAVEKEPPYACALYEPDHEDLKRARTTYQDWLRKLHIYQQEHADEVWPAYTSGGPMVLPAPRWARPREEAFE